jgi:hypothetical protein
VTPLEAHAEMQLLQRRPAPPSPPPPPRRALARAGLGRCVSGVE